MIGVAEAMRAVWKVLCGVNSHVFVASGDISVASARPHRMCPPDSSKTLNAFAILFLDFRANLTACRSTRHKPAHWLIEQQISSPGTSRPRPVFAQPLLDRRPYLTSSSALGTLLSGTPWINPYLRPCHGPSLSSPLWNRRSPASLSLCASSMHVSFFCFPLPSQLPRYKWDGLCLQERIYLHSDKNSLEVCTSLILSL